MDTNDAENFQRMWFVTFAVQRLNGVADSLARWMAHGVIVSGNGRHIHFGECDAAARTYFTVRPQLAAVASLHAQALTAARRVTDHHATFLARPSQGDIAALLADASGALDGLAAVLEQLPEYAPASAEAAALRHEALRCASLRPRAAPPGSGPEA